MTCFTMNTIVRCPLKLYMRKEWNLSLVCGKSRSFSLAMSFVVFVRHKCFWIEMVARVLRTTEWNGVEPTDSISFEHFKLWFLNLKLRAVRRKFFSAGWMAAAGSTDVSLAGVSSFSTSLPTGSGQSFLFASLNCLDPRQQPPTMHHCRLRGWLAVDHRGEPRQSEASCGGWVCYSLIGYCANFIHSHRHSVFRSVAENFGMIFVCKWSLCVVIWCMVTILLTFSAL